jgi:hypothetical protein
MQGRCNNNTATAIAGVNSNGIYLAQYGSGNHKTEVLNNTVSGTKNYGIVIESNDNAVNGSMGRMDATVKNNNVTMIDNAYAHIGVIAIANSTMSASLKTCANVGGNATNSPVAGLAAGHFDVLAQNTGSSITQIILEGATVFSPIAPPGSDQTTRLISFWNANNVGTRTAIDEVGGGSIITGTCFTPSNPTAAIASDIIAQNNVEENLPELNQIKEFVDKPQDVVNTLIHPDENIISEKESKQLSGETITVDGSGSGFNIPVSKSTTIKYSATISSSPTQCDIPDQGTVSGNFTNVLTDDPTVSGATNPTVVNVVAPGINTGSTISSTTVCSGGSITLNATCPAGSTIKWYTASSGGSMVSTSETYSPTNITANTSYYASCLLNGCESARTLVGSVTVLALPGATISSIPNLTVCSDLTVNLSAPPGGTLYQWTGSGVSSLNASSINVLPAASGSQVYTVTVTGSNGCTASGTKSIFVNPALSAEGSVVQPVSCFGGSNGSVKVTPSGGTSPYSYNWNGTPTGDGTATITGLISGTYTCTITDANMCTATASVMQTTNTAMTVTINKTDVSCFGGNNGSATASTSGGVPGYTYVWTNGATTATITNLVAGSYTVTVTDANGCTKTASTMIAQPPQVNPTVSITSSTLNYILPSATIFTATHTNGGTPTFVWKKNGITVGTDSDTYSDAALLAGDTIQVFMTSSQLCASPPTVNSNKIGMKKPPATLLVSSTGSCIASPVLLQLQSTLVENKVWYSAPYQSGTMHINWNTSVWDIIYTFGTSETIARNHNNTEYPPYTSQHAWFSVIEVCESQSVIVSDCISPTAYTITGSGVYCTGLGLEISLSDSETGVDYQLKNGVINVTTVSGTGGPLSFGVHPTGTYTIVATRVVGACTTNMNGSAVIRQANASPHRVYYVDAAQDGNGSSWANALSTLDILNINECINTDDTILVAAGTYSPSGLGSSIERTQSFKIKGNLTVLGGYPSGGGVRNPTINETILTGVIDGFIPGARSLEISSRSDAPLKSYHVVTSINANGPSTLDGFTITKGVADGLDTNSVGAGIYIKNSALTMRNLKIIDNFALDRGSGLHARGGVILLQDSKIIENEGPASPGHTAAINFDGNGKRNIDRCNISHNTGIGVAAIGMGKTTVKNSLLSHNSSFVTYLVNDPDTLELINNTIVDNNRGLHQIFGIFKVYNNIIADNGPGLYAGAGDIFDYKNNIIKGVNSSGNINANPLFVDQANENYNIICGSPARNTGMSMYNPTSTHDLALHPRYFGGVLDLGALENQELAGKTTMLSSRGTFKNAVYLACPTDIIMMDSPSNYMETVADTFHIDKEITLMGNGSGHTFSINKVLTVDVNKLFGIKDLIFTSPYILNKGTLKLSSADISGTEAPTYPPIVNKGVVEVLAGRSVVH